MTTSDVIEVEPGPPPRGGRARRLGVGVAIGALVAAAGAVVWTSRDTGTAAAGGGTRCPASTPNAFAPTFDLPVPVPEQPTASGLAGRLVPARAPQSVVLCEYGASVSVAVGVGPAEVGTDVASSAAASPGVAPDVSAAVPTTVPTVVPPASAPTDLTLGRVAEHAGSDPAVAQLLTLLQQATVRENSAGYGDCAGSYVDGEVTPEYLVGLAYDDGVVWIAGPDVCRGSTNGVATSAVDITGPVTALLDSGGGTDGNVGTASVVPPSAVVEPGSVTPAPSGSEPGSAGPGGTEPTSSGPGSSTADPPDPFAACAASGVGPRAPDGVLLPFTPTSVRVCHQEVGPAVTGPSVVDEPAEVAGRLAVALNALPLSPADEACPAIGGEQWALLFGGMQEVRPVTTRIFVDAGGCGTASNGLVIVRTDAAFSALLRTLT